MKRQWLFILAIVGAVGLGLFSLAYFLRTHTEDTSSAIRLDTITLRKPVHFLAPDGSDIVTSPGYYEVQAAEGALRLVPAGGQASLVIQATATTHEEGVSAPTALSVTEEEGEKADILHVVLLLPGGKSLDAAGSYSGVRTRGLRDRLAERPLVKKVAAFARQQAQQVGVMTCKAGLRTRPAALVRLAPVKAQAASVLRNPQFMQLVQEAIPTLFRDREKSEAIRNLVELARVWTDPRNQERIRSLLGAERLCERPFDETVTEIAKLYQGQPQPRSVLFPNSSWTFALAGEAAYFAGIQGSIGVVTPNLPIGLLPKPDLSHGRVFWSIGGTGVADIDAKGAAKMGFWFEPPPENVENNFDLSVKGGAETGLGFEVELHFGWNRVLDEWRSKRLQSLIPYLAGIEVAPTATVTPGASVGLDIGYTRVTRFAW